MKNQPLLRPKISQKSSRKSLLRKLLLKKLLKSQSNKLSRSLPQLKPLQFKKLLFLLNQWKLLLELFHLFLWSKIDLTYGLLVQIKDTPFPLLQLVLLVLSLKDNTKALFLKIDFFSLDKPSLKTKLDIPRIFLSIKKLQISKKLIHLRTKWTSI